MNINVLILGGGPMVRAAAYFGISPDEVIDGIKL
jgi:hypothetical protein